MERIEQRSHGDLETDADDRKCELDEQVERQDVTVEDKFEVARTGAELTLGYTQEAVDAVVECFERAGEVLDRAVDEQSDRHGEIAAEGVAEEEALDRSANEANDDGQDSRASASDVETAEARALVEEAGATLEDEGRWLEELRQRMESDRAASEERTRQQVAEVHGTAVKVGAEKG